MEKISLYTFLLIAFFLLEMAYMRIARYFNINAVPNHRSSHTQITVTGGGIIFPIACISYFLTSRLQYPFFIGGILLVALVSFIDDIKEASIKLRLIVHMVAVCLLFLDVELYIAHTLMLLLIMVVVVVSLNAYNFMDGINGITVVYSLVQFATFFYVNHFVIHFIDEDLLVIAGIGLLVFKFFNFRIKAKCFAGDVGSISIAFTVCFCLLKLIGQTQNLLFINFLLVYYLDAIITFIYRWITGEKVTEAHKEHFYQYLANKLKWHHITVAVVYGLVQAIINLAIINFYSIKGDSLNSYNSGYAILFIVIASGLFVFMRIKLEWKALNFKKRPVSQNMNIDPVNPL